VGSGKFCFPKESAIIEKNFPKSIQQILVQAPGIVLGEKCLSPVHYRLYFST